MQTRGYQVQDKLDGVKDAGDAIAVTAGLSVFLGWIPSAVGILTICYTIWRFVDSLERRRQMHQWPFASWGSLGNAAPKADKPDTQE